MEVRYFERFCDVIKAIRRDRQLSQRAMAKEIRVSPGYVGQWELGLSKPSAEVVKRICKLYSVNDEEYMLRLAYAETAPEFLRESIVRYRPDETDRENYLNPLETRIIEHVRRLPGMRREQLAMKIETWVDAMIEADRALSVS